MTSELLGKEEQVVLTEGAYFNEVGEFVVGDVRFVVSADEFL